MVDLSPFSASIGRASEETEDWFKPVLDRGRAAVFVDTAFLQALIVPDQWSDLARIQYEDTERTNLYTTTLVFSELIRHVAKRKRVGGNLRNDWFQKCTEMLIEPGVVLVCSPPRELARNAYLDFLKQSSRLPGLDLCDAVTLKVLEYARHRRIFSFDTGHLSAFGALVEPGPV